MADSSENNVVRRTLDTDGENPGEQVAREVAAIKGTDPTALTTIYDCLDGVLDDIYDTPPSPEADVAVSFDYEGYRITVEQDGTATFEPK